MQADSARDYHVILESNEDNNVTQIVFPEQITDSLSRCRSIMRILILLRCKAEDEVKKLKEILKEYRLKIIYLKKAFYTLIF